MTHAAVEPKPNRKRFLVEYAARDRKCHNCTQEIHKNQFCVGYKPSHESTFAWMHAPCLTITQKADIYETYGEPAYVEDFDSIAPTHQTLFLNEVTNKEHQPVFVPSASHPTGEVHRHGHVDYSLLTEAHLAPRHINAPVPPIAGVEAFPALAPTTEAAVAPHMVRATHLGRHHAVPHHWFADQKLRDMQADFVVKCCDDKHKCTVCHDDIMTKELCVGVKMTTNHRYRHLSCVDRSFAAFVRTMVPEWKQMAGFDSLTAEQQQHVLKRFTETYEN